MEWAHLAQAQVLKTLDTVVLKTKDTQTGADCIVKLYRLQKKNLWAQIPDIGAYLNWVNVQFPDMQIQVPIYQPAHSIDYGTIKQTESDERWMVVYPWVKGHTPKKITPKLCYHIGRKMAQLHLAAQQFEPVLPLTQINHQLLSDILVLVKQSDLFRQMPTEIKDNFEATMGQLASFVQRVGYEKQQYGLIHSDLHFGNWLRNGNRLTPIDFDETAYGHYLTDIAVVCNEIEFGVPLSNYTETEEALLKGYQNLCKLPKNWVEMLPVFKKIGLSLYLNWIFSPNNYSVLAGFGKQKFATNIILKIAK